MRTVFTLITTVFLLCNFANAQETMYFYKWGYLTDSTAVANVDSILFNRTPGKAMIADADSNVYHTITIGTQEWFRENLKTTKFNDGTAIPLISDNAAWKVLKTPGYAIYHEVFPTTAYGIHYNWYAVETYKLCPTGWHVATFEEWEILNNFLGGSDVSGGKMKTVSGGPWYEGWDGPNTGNSNSSGFFGVAAGTRGIDGAFNDWGWASRFWTEPEDSGDPTKARFKMLHSTTANLWQGSELKTAGYSVRCIKD